MSNTRALCGKAAARYGAPTEPFGSLTTIQSPSSASGNLESATRETKRRIPSSHACLCASAITKFLLRRLFGRAPEWKSPKSLPTRGSFHNLPPAMSPIIEANHVLPLRPVPKIHTSLSAPSSSMTCIVADGAGNGKVPERAPPAGYLTGTTGPSSVRSDRGYAGCHTRTSENSVQAKFAEFPFRNCLKSRSVVSHEQVSFAYRSKMGPFDPFRRLLRPSFRDYPDFLDSLSETVWKFGIGPESGLREQPRGVEGVPIRAPLAAREAR